ncbi:MAG: HEPN domain-containing protein [Candidatus Symbiothrix sp.]|jgi:uncharacterized protein (UPF0332 family)|nr:HEPN domain-containing protein [Candidatus Symbiothrix sp.]
MKQQVLNEESLTALISYRIKRSKETLQEADVLINGKFYNAAINRLYYACYYAVIALLLKNEIAAQTHQGVKQMFSLHFIATGKLDKKYSSFYSRLFNDRISGDYDDFLQYDEEMIKEIRPLAEEFIGAVEAII